MRQIVLSAADTVRILVYIWSYAVSFRVSYLNPHNFGGQFVIVLTYVI
jgi:hypothetical protein